MRFTVVGAGAWGLPAAAELAARGHEVVLLDRYGVGNPWASSSGPTRLWRLTHPDVARVRLARRSVEAMERLESRSGARVFLRRGLLWRDDVTAAAAAGALAGAGVPHTVVEPGDVGRFFPGLAPDGRPAVWQDDAGPVLADASLRAQRALFEAAGGRLVVGSVVREVTTTSHGVRTTCADGRASDSDGVVLAPGPGAGPLLAALGVGLPLAPRLEQVVHVGGPDGPAATDPLPCLFEGPAGADPGLYAMPTPGVGYKLGLDRRVRDLPADDFGADTDRTPDPALTAAVLERVRRTMPGGLGAAPRALDATVCSWTVSPDGRFVVDTLPGGITLACGDSGEGFKFSALMGLVLADLAEGHAPDDDVAGFALARFADGVPAAADHVLGR